MNTDLRKKAKNDFEKDFAQLMNNSVFGKTREIVRKTQKRRRNYLVSEPDQHTTKFFTEMKIKRNRNEKKTEILMNKPVNLGLSILGCKI